MNKTVNNASTALSNREDGFVVRTKTVRSGRFRPLPTNKQKTTETLRPALLSCGEGLGKRSSAAP